MRKILCALPVLLLAACNANPTASAKAAAEREARGEYRRALFLECLKTVPQGPATVHENGDWEGIVTACSNSAYYVTNERFR